MKRKFFDLKLYIQNLRRLRIVGLAASIACVAISILIPIYGMITYQRYDYVEETTEIVHAALVTLPALVASYVLPLLVFVAFSYLFKRRDSDFYHAIPHTRTCVYVSTMAAVLTWSLGTLILSSFASAALWAFVPHTTFSFIGVLVQMVYMSVNTLFLSAVAVLAVSLVGTFATSVIAAGLILFSWRFMLYMAMLILDDNPLVVGEALLGGYLNPGYLFPFAIITHEASGIPWSVVLYTAIIALCLLVLGGVAYHRRNSETAGRAVPGGALQVLLRCLLALPTTLLLVYQLLCGSISDGTVLVLVVITLLIFYLYELLTTKSVRSMLRATPWLGVLVAAGVLFGGVSAAANDGITAKKLPAEQIAAVGFDERTSLYNYGVGGYEMNRMEEYLTENANAIGGVAEALEHAQNHVDSFYSSRAREGRAEITVDILTTSGLRMTRRVLIRQEDLSLLIGAVREELHLSPIPSAAEVVSAYVGNQNLLLDPAKIPALLTLIKQEWDDMPDKAASLIQYNACALPLGLEIRRNENYNHWWIDYYVDPDLMPRTYEFLCSAMVDPTLTPDGLREMLTAYGDVEETTVGYVAYLPALEAANTWIWHSNGTAQEVLDFILAHADDLTFDDLATATRIEMRLEKAQKIIVGNPNSMGAEMDYKYEEKAEADVTWESVEVCLFLHLDVQEQRELSKLIPSLSD